MDKESVIENIPGYSAEQMTIGMILLVLVVEDDDTLNKMICANLKQDKFQVQTAFDGEHALEIMDQYHIDLIICDIMKPRMNGYEFVELIRKAKYTLPILMITAKE